MLAWEEKYRVGVGRIDTHHKQLFEFANDIEQSLQAGKLPPGAEEAVGFLVDYAKLHFEHEEKCMARHQCPIAHRNQEAHKQFLSAIATFQERLGKDPDIKLLANIHNFLESWLTNHICTIDVQLRPYGE